MNRWLILLLSLPMLAMAAEPAPLGRLFLTPGERAALDVVRQNNRPPEKIITPGAMGEDEESANAPAAPPPIVTVHGYVKRSDGKGTVWVNDQSVQEKSTSNNIEIGKLQGNTNDVQIKLPSTGQTIKLKAGQSYDPGSGKVGSLREIAPHPEATPTIPDIQEKLPTPASKAAPSTEKPAPGTPAPATPASR